MPVKSAPRSNNKNNLPVVHSPILYLVIEILKTKVLKHLIN